MDWIDIGRDENKWQSGAIEQGNGLSGTIKCGKCFELRNYKLLKKDSAACS